MTKREYKKVIENLQRELKDKQIQITEITGINKKLNDYLCEIEKELFLNKSRYRTPLIFGAGVLTGIIINIIQGVM